MKTIETNYYSLLNTKKHLTKDIDNIYENFYEMDCRINQNNQYSRRENLIITGIPNTVHQPDLESTVLNVLRVFGLKKNLIVRYCRMSLDKVKKY